MVTGAPLRVDSRASVVSGGGGVDGGAAAAAVACKSVVVGLGIQPNNYDDDDDDDDGGGGGMVVVVAAAAAAACNRFAWIKNIKSFIKPRTTGYIQYVYGIPLRPNKVPSKNQRPWKDDITTNFLTTKRFLKDNPLVFYNLVKVYSIYTKLKDKVDKLDQSNLVYKIPCECDKCYIGQTKEKLKKRIDQYRNDCKLTNAQKTNNTTALAEHHFKTGYNFKFDTATILDLEDNCPRAIDSRAARARGPPPFHRREERSGGGWEKRRDDRGGERSAATREGVYSTTVAPTEQCAGKRATTWRGPNDASGCAAAAAAAATVLDGGSTVSGSGSGSGGAGDADGEGQTATATATATATTMAMAMAATMASASVTVTVTTTTTTLPVAAAMGVEDVALNRFAP
ncbi:hypothetical protein M0804_003138 [Polistes exclamans]|nr:hypothetical protein M0804_003138 [Polistes exclamans]